MIRLDRAEFLQRLESVRAGLSATEQTEQSSSFAFRNGRVLTFDGNVCCKAPTGLPKDFRTAVRGRQLLDLLTALEDDEIGIEADPERLWVHGKGRKKFWVRAEPDVTMPVDEVDKAGEWVELHPDFLDAVKMATACAAKDRKDGKFNKAACVHVHPQWVESCNLFQLARFKVETGVAEPCLVKAEAVKAIVPLGMTDLSETAHWLQFYNPSGLIVACRRFTDDYPDLSSKLKLRGEPMAIPKALTMACKLVGLFSREIKDNDKVNVSLRKGSITVVGEGVLAGGEVGRNVEYDGPDLDFSIAPQLLGDIADKYTDIEISETILRADGGRWTFVASLSKPVPQNGVKHVQGKEEEYVESEEETAERQD